MAKRWEKLVVPRLQAMSGFQHAYFSGDVAANVTVAISLWNENSDPDRPLV